MNSIDAIRPSLTEFALKMAKVGRKSVSIQEDDVVGIDGVNRWNAPVVPELKSFVRWIRRFVQNVIASDPRVALVVRCEFLPEPNSSVLKVFVHPEAGDVGWVVRVPVLPTMSQS